MSADNGIYIGRFKGTDGSHEYRVIHAQAIENCDKDVRDSADIQKAYLIQYYGKAKVIKTRDEAFAEARRLYDELMAEYPICEYGIQEIPYDEPFPTQSQEWAGKVLEEWWNPQKNIR